MFWGFTKNSSTLPCVVWAEKSKIGLRFEIGPRQQKFQRSPSVHLMGNPAVDLQYVSPLQPSCCSPGIEHQCQSNNLSLKFTVCLGSMMNIFICVSNRMFLKRYYWEFFPVQRCMSIYLPISKKLCDRSPPTCVQQYSNVLVESNTAGLDVLRRHTKIICRETERTTTDLNKRMKSSRRGAFNGAW